jgi:uncharacterized protein DUF6600
MTTMRAFLLGILLALLIVPGAPAQAQDRDFDIDIFYEELAPYGDWFEHPRWGVVWQPRVDRDWRPYTHGYWSFTDDHGWYWDSDEAWGWAVFHYGRWVLDEDDGWLWIPGFEWGPAWVAWRWSDDYVGWAALAPGSDWGPDDGLRYDIGFYESAYYASAWCFVHPRYMTTPGLYRYLAPRTQNVVILRRTRHVPGYRRFDRRVVNSGFDVRRFEQLVGRPVPRVRLRSVDSPRDLGGRRDRGPDVHVFMPRIISRPDGPKRPPQLKARPERPIGPGPSITGRPPEGQPGVPLKRDAEPGSPPRVITPPPSGIPKQQLKQATPPPDASPSAPRKSGPPPDTGVQRKAGPPPPPSGLPASPKIINRPDARPQGPPPSVGPPPARKQPPPAKKDDKDKTSEPK